MNETSVVLITGTRTGIGEMLARHFLECGYVVEGCSRGSAGWHETHYTHHCTDVSDETAVKSMVTDVRRRHGRIDVLINNAGTASMNHTLLTPASAVDKIMATNVRGTFLVSREVAKLMQRRRYGRIVNLTTVAVPLCLEGEAIYAASKSAVATFTRIFAREIAPFGVTCNAVGPGPVETDMTRAIPSDKMSELVNRLAIKRPCTFRDVANVIDFLVKPESDYVTGQIIYLGGVG